MCVFVCLIWICKDETENETFLRFFFLFAPSRLIAPLLICLIGTLFKIQYQSNIRLCQSIKFQLTIGLNETHSWSHKNQVEQRIFSFNSEYIFIENKSNNTYFFSSETQVSIDAPYDFIHETSFSKHLESCQFLNWTHIEQKNVQSIHTFYRIDFAQYTTCRMITFAFFNKMHTLFVRNKI